MILVTGATGGVGGDVARALAAAGAKVRLLARDPAKAEKLGLAAEIAKGDLAAPQTLGPALAGTEKLFLMGVAESLGKIAADAAKAAKAAGVRHIVFLSSSTTLYEPIGALGRWHLDGERAIEATGVAWTFLRPGNFATNALNWAHMIKGQGAVYAPAGGTSAPIDPYDIAAVGAKALLEDGHEGKRYVLTSEELMTVTRQVEIVGEVIGKPLRHVEVPVAAARAGMLQSGMPPTLVDALVELLEHAPTAKPELTTTVREVTGRAPRTFAEWAKANAAAFV